jgi:curli biogenesis system outer membrane secretion channel CsgG
MKIVLMLPALCCALATSPLWAQQQKPVVGIYEMQDNTRTEPEPRRASQSGYSRRYEEAVSQSSQSTLRQPSQLSMQIQDMLAQAIVATNKFSVIERSQLRYLINEQLKARSGLVTTNTPGRIGGFEGVDYLIYGTINQASTERKTHTQTTENKNYGLSVLGSFLSGGQQSSQPKQFTQSCLYDLFTLSINIKITDARTGEVRYSSPVDQNGITATNCPGVEASTVADVQRRSSRDLAFNLVTAIYPMQVASILSNGHFVVNYGEGSLAPQELLAFYSKGAEILDPATGERIGNDEVLIGLAEVSEVNVKFSKVIPVYGFGTPASVGSIARKATPQLTQEWEQMKANAKAEAEAPKRKKR